MNKRLICLLILSFMVGSFVSAQKKKDPDEIPTVVYEMEYSLPKVLFKVDLTLQEIHNLPGPYSQYAESKLGIVPSIQSEESVWAMKGVKITPVSVPDAECRYTIQSSPDNPILQLSVTPDGMLAGVGVNSNSGVTTSVVSANIVNAEAVAKNPYSVGTYNFLEYVVDSVFVEVKGPKNVVTQQFDPNSPYHYNVKSSEEAVKEILDKIYDLRIDRNDLLRGDREVDESASMATILKNYEKLEKEYFALFLGSSDTAVHNYTLYIDPVNINTGQVAFRISESRGVVNAKDNSAKPVILTYSNVQKPLQAPAQLAAQDLAYRVPATARVTVSYDNSELISFNTIIPQWGVVQKFSDYELSNLQLQFYPEYGTLKSAVVK